MPAADPRKYRHDVMTYCRMDRRHTMCKYRDGARGKCGNKVCARGFTEEAQQTKLVNKHNEFRREIADGEEEITEKRYFPFLQVMFLQVMNLARESQARQTWKWLSGTMRLQELLRGKQLCDWSDCI